MSEFRQVSRYSVFLPVAVSVNNDNHQQKVTGTVAGRIINISHQGACVLLSRAMIDHFHFFHSFQENDSTNLHLYIQNGGTATLKVTARPVWFETVYLADAKIFKIGINFNNGLEQNDLKKISIVTERHEH